MNSESSLYQKVWGEPHKNELLPPAGVAAGNGKEALNPSGPTELFLVEDEVVKPAGDVVADLTLLRVEQVEAKVSEIQRLSAETRKLLDIGIAELTDTLNTMRWAPAQEESGDASDAEILLALEGLESRIVRLEKGVLRSLEYLDSRIEALERS